MPTNLDKWRPSENVSCRCLDQIQEEEVGVIIMYDLYLILLDEISFSNFILKKLRNWGDKLETK